MSLPASTIVTVILSMNKETIAAEYLLSFKLSLTLFQCSITLFPQTFALTLKYFNSFSIFILYIF
ncbi:hypothetical protein [Bacillus pacificus]|uniref:hypothetical protein n=1 Tax=Bacillus pacificus TaxID=2026187 RepID=UPI00399D14FD